MFSPSPFLTNSGDSNKKFHSQFQFFSTNILAAEVTTVRLSVDCVGSGRIVLFAPIGRASHHLSRSHFSTWLGLSRCVLNRTLAASTAPAVVTPHCLSVSTSRVGNRSLCTKRRYIWKPVASQEKAEKNFIIQIHAQNMWYSHQWKGLAEFSKIMKAFSSYKRS